MAKIFERCPEPRPRSHRCVFVWKRTFFYPFSLSVHPNTIKSGGVWPKTQSEDFWKKRRSGRKRRFSKTFTSLLISRESTPEQSLVTKCSRSKMSNENNGDAKRFMRFKKLHTKASENAFRAFVANREENLENTHHCDAKFSNGI